MLNPETITALVAADTFISGFEGDTDQQPAADSALRMIRRQLAEQPTEALRIGERLAARRAFWDQPHTFAVQGTGEFPADMLRHSSAWPVDTESAAAMFGEGERVVILRGQFFRFINAARWASFGWPIIKGNPQEMDMSMNLDGPTADHIPPALRLVLSDILDYQADEFDAKPASYQVIVGSTKEGGSQQLFGPYDTLDEATAYARSRLAEGHRVTIQPGEVPDLQVSGADLVDAFTRFREMIKAALAFPCDDPLPTILRASMIKPPASGGGVMLPSDNLEELQAIRDAAAKFISRTAHVTFGEGSMVRASFTELKQAVEAEARS